MSTDPLLPQIVDELVSKHHAHTILFYGSRANGTAGPESDYDIVAFAPRERLLRDARVLDGAYLDLFIYPESRLQQSPDEEMLRLRGCRILRQRGQEAQALLDGLEALYQRGPEPLSADESQARRVWALKMVARAQRGDVEGHYRRAWLLYMLLEDHFHLRGRWYPGPKKALRELQASDPETYAAFAAALEPGAALAAVELLARRIVG